MSSLPTPAFEFTFRSVFFMVIMWTGLFCNAEINGGVNVRVLLGKGEGSEQREFDYFMLALQWPGTYCRRTRHCCSSNGCCRGLNGPTGFTIHGLWADYNDGTWPSCCTGKTFDIKEISTLLGALNKYWPSLSCGSSSNCHGGKGLFWEHEEVLGEAGYVASNSEKYPLGGIILAIQDAFHATPELECSGDTVQELHLCFYKDFKN